MSKHGSLRVNGTTLTNEKGVPVVLRGISYGWHCFWPRFYNAGSVAWLKKDWKINVIRAAPSGTKTRELIRKYNR